MVSTWLSYKLDDSCRSAQAVSMVPHPRPSTGTAALTAPPTPGSVLTPAYAASAVSMTFSGPGSPLIAAGRYPAGPSPFHESPRLGVNSGLPNAAQQLVSGVTHAAMHPVNRTARAAQSIASSSDQLLHKPS